MAGPSVVLWSSDSVVAEVETGPAAGSHRACREPQPHAAARQAHREALAVGTAHTKLTSIGPTYVLENLMQLSDAKGLFLTMYGDTDNEGSKTPNPEATLMYDLFQKVMFPAP